MSLEKQSSKKYQAKETRYKSMQYRRCGKSGLLLPVISLGLWHNFGRDDNFANARDIIRTSFDCGITHFDLANNYGPPPGTAEETFGKILKKDFKHYRDELLISSKAGYTMWDGPYGDFGSKKYLISSIDQSLKRTGLDYFDIFYHHRPDPDTPLEETMDALHQIVQQGKALYVGISRYPATLTRKASEILNKMGTKLLIHQPRYNMMDRNVEKNLLEELAVQEMGAIVFSPLNQGILTDKYLNGFPEESRALKDKRFLTKEHITKEKLDKVHQLNNLAKERKQSLAQMAIAWLLKDNRVTSVLVGVSRPEQILDNVRSIENLAFSEAELTKIEQILNS